jgi:hypothetical protein
MLTSHLDHDGPASLRHTAGAACACTHGCGCDGSEQGCLCPAPRATKATRSTRAARHTGTGQRRRWAGIAAAAAAIGAMTALSACAFTGKRVPPGLDVAAVRLSENAAYRVSYASQPAPVPINQLHRWTLHVATADGRPVTDAQIKVDGDMPQHGHGLPTRPRVTANLGNGDYQVDGIRFQMGGWWVMEFTIDARGRRDVAKFNLMLQP